MARAGETSNSIDEGHAMMTSNTTGTPTPPTPERRRPSALLLLSVIVVTALATALIAALLTNIFVRKQEAKDPYLKFVNVDNNTTDAEEWGTGGRRTRRGRGSGGRRRCRNRSSRMTRG
jgi:hypothetical protein